MKILLVHNRYKEAGGEDVVFQNESDLLRDHGHEVEHLVFDNATIKTLTDKLLAGIRTVYNNASARMVQETIERFSPDVIHVHNFVPLASPSVLFVASRNKIPLVMTLHNYRLICPSATLFHNNEIYEKSLHSLFPWDAVRRGVYRNSIIQTFVIAFMTAWHNLTGTWRNKVDLYITLTQFAKDKFTHSALALPDHKLVVKPNFVKAPGKDATTRGDFFLFVGRLTEEKGIKSLLRATNLYDFKLVIIGDGPLRFLVEYFAQNNSNIQYLGFQNKSSVFNYLKTCRALIFPSIWYEGFPVTILEAFSTGTVVLASKLGGMEEIIQNHVNGVHFEAGNEYDLAVKVMELSNSPRELESISANASTTFQEHYAPEKNHEMLTDIYRQAIAYKAKHRETAAGVLHDPSKVNAGISDKPRRAPDNAQHFPLVTIGLPTYNSNGKIANALKSIATQEYPNLEVIISDNCSTDNTSEVCAQISKAHPEIRYFRQPTNIGLVPNFEFVLKKARGDFFMWIADDDQLEPGILKRYVEYLTGHPDYSLVSGQINYSRDHQSIFREKDLSLEENSPDKRVLHYYTSVMYGGLFHGLMNRRLAAKIPLINCIGNDFLFVANLSYLGKVKQFDYVGYNKGLNGTSRNFMHYAKVIGASWFSGTFPRLSIARDAFFEILSRSPVYTMRSAPARFMLATFSWAGILISYYGMKYPFIVGGSIKRRIWNPVRARFGFQKI